MVEHFVVKKFMFAISSPDEFLVDTVKIFDKFFTLVPTMPLLEAAPTTSAQRTQQTQKTPAHVSYFTVSK